MTELYIDKQLAVLPLNISITLIEENPFFTKNGTHTLDIELSLKEPANAKIFGHANRKNKLFEPRSQQSAVLIVDNEVVLNGTARYRGKTDKTVKIQLISGNSELNFLIGGDRRLRDLNLGSAVPFTVPPGTTSASNEIAKLVWHSLKERYPARNWHLLPYFAGIDDFGNRVHGNRYVLYDGTGFDPDNLGENHPDFLNWRAYYIPSFSGQVPQPYLCFIIDKVVESLGYAMSYNTLAQHPVYKEAYIVHGFQTLEFAKMLPSWTVNEFLSNIEKQFDCTFVVDQRYNTVRLLFNSQRNESEQAKTLVVHDSYTTETDEGNRLDVRTSNIAYSLDNTDLYYAYMDMDRRIKERSERLSMIVPYTTLDEMRLMVQDATDTNRFKKIYTDGYDQFVAFRTGQLVNGIEEVIPQRVNSFAPLYNNPDSTEIDINFPIIPASMVYAYASAFPSGYYHQFPVAGDYDPLYNGDPSTREDFDTIFDIQQLVEGDMNFPDDLSYSSMRLAIYAGVQEMDSVADNGGRLGFLPAIYVESLAEYYEETNITRWFGPIQGDPFRLKNLNRDIYSLVANIDTTETYNLTFDNVQMFNITSKFVADNKLFICNKIERHITIDGFEATAEGEFYPIN